MLLGSEVCCCNLCMCLNMCSCCSFTVLSVQVILLSFRVAQSFLPHFSLHTIINVIYIIILLVFLTVICYLLLLLLLVLLLLLLLLLFISTELFALCDKFLGWGCGWGCGWWLGCRQDRLWGRLLWFPFPPPCPRRSQPSDA